MWLNRIRNFGQKQAKVKHSVEFFHCFLFHCSMLFCWYISSGSIYWVIILRSLANDADNCDVTPFAGNPVTCSASTRFSSSAGETFSLLFMVMNMVCIISFCRFSMSSGLRNMSMWKFGCFLACFVKWSLRLNFIEQRGQMNRFSPVCTLIWRLSSSERTNCLLHPGHSQGKGRSPKTKY